MSMTILEADKKWVDGFNAIPREMIARFMQYEPESWSEVTTPQDGDRVYIAMLQAEGEIIKSDDDYEVLLDSGKSVIVNELDFEVIYSEVLPIWGTMWSMGSPLDEDWLDTEKGLSAMSKCGFRIFEHEEFGYFFGIDGAGYDFYKEHWIPLYNARGLHWHGKEGEKNEEY